jgi:hypothetical protein
MITLVGSLCAIWTSCVIFHGPAESAFRVKGRIVKSDTADSRECILQLYRAEGKKPIRKVNVPREFVESSTIAPGFHRYYMVITCPGSPGQYTSYVFELGGSRHHAQPLDLGTIDLARPGPKAETGPDAPSPGNDTR